MQTGTCLRMYLSESDTIDSMPVLEAILGLCQNNGLQGVSVFRAIEGLGKHGIHSSSFLSLSSNLPLVVEVLDTEERIQQALPLIQEKLPSALIASWPINLVQTVSE